MAFLSGKRRYTVAGADRRPALVRRASVSTAACTTRAAAAASSRSTSSPGAWLSPAAFRHQHHACRSALRDHAGVVAGEADDLGRISGVETPLKVPRSVAAGAASVLRIGPGRTTLSPQEILAASSSGPTGPQGQARPGLEGALARGHARGHGELVPGARTRAHRAGPSLAAAPVPGRRLGDLGGRGRGGRGRARVARSRRARAVTPRAWS